MNEFIDYFLSFYGEGGIYDFGANREDILKAIGIRIAIRPEMPFHGDSIDREAVRDILIEQFGYQWPDAA